MESEPELSEGSAADSLGTEEDGSIKGEPSEEECEREEQERAPSPGTTNQAEITDKLSTDSKVPAVDINTFKGVGEKSKELSAMERMPPEGQEDGGHVSALWLTMTASVYT